MPHIVVAGGGMIGAATALTLARAGHPVTVLDPGSPPTLSPTAGPYRTRVIAVNLASVELLETLDVWGLVAAQGVSPLRGMRIWSQSPDQSLSFDSADLGQPELGFIVENELLTAALWQVLLETAGVEHRATTLAGADWPQRAGEAVQVLCGDGREITADLLIAADGARSVGRLAAGFSSSWRAYGQSALVAQVQTECPHREIAYQRFLPSGPLAFLPLLGASSIVWSLPSKAAERTLKLGESEFRGVLQEAFGDTLGCLGEIGPRSFFPLLRQHVDGYQRPGILLLGDAAHTVHPLAGQGANLGFNDVSALQQLVTQHPREWCQKAGLLQRFARQRRAENSQMIAGMEGLKGLFALQRFAGPAMVSGGLGLVDSLPLLKRFFIHRAGGLV